MELAQLIKDTTVSKYGKEPIDASIREIHNALGEVIMGIISNNWYKSRNTFKSKRHVYYLSAEFLMGRAIQNNLISLGIFDKIKASLLSLGVNINDFEEIGDMALGNGGLGRLAACFLDSAASWEIPVQGYGIRYKYGIFRQSIDNGFQKEHGDNWSAFGDPWSLRKFEESVRINFSDIQVMAVPYDVPIIGYDSKNIGTLRLWQSEAIEDFNFELFNSYKYSDSISQKTLAENITAALYPNDNKYEGKVLRYRQQYFFSSASIQDMVRVYREKFGDDFSRIIEMNAIQLNDTHPVISIPEFIRIMTLENGLAFNKALDMAKKIFNYTNHTVMVEALEKWDVELIKEITPEIFEIIVTINNKLENELKRKKIKKNQRDSYMIIFQNKVHMARMAAYVCNSINGVAEIHSYILKKDTLKEWFSIYPNKFQNKTNGVTQRRWLGTCNPELTEFYRRLLGDDSFLKDLSKLKILEKYIDNDKVIGEFINIKKVKKKQLINYIEKQEGIKLDENFIFDVQIKRLHEYKRQLMNVLSILDIYYKLKNNELENFNPTVFIFGGKAAPGYARAKAIIKFINEVAELINNDIDVK